MNLIDSLVSGNAEARAIRRDLHAHPELRFEERRTSDLVAGVLARLGIEVHRGLGGTGLVGVLRAGASTRTIGLRADMDALPMQELNGFEHRSRFDGRMHACGHDGHMAMLLAAASHLAKTRSFDGTVHLIFQPAEEGGAGARRMIEDGLFRRFACDAVFALHNWPGFPFGHFVALPGPVMASTNEFDILVRGLGGHAAMPHLAHDPVLTAAQIVQGLQSIVSREKDPARSAVLSVTRLQAGEAINAIPDEARIGGTVRTFDDEVTALFEERIGRIARFTAQAHGCDADVQFQRSYPATVNHPREARFAAEVAAGVVGATQVTTDADPRLAAEDFAFMLRERPGAYLLLGYGEGGHRDIGHGAGPCTLHNASYDFNDDLIPVGASFWVRLVERFLAPA